MLVSQYITALEEFKEKYGDLPVETYGIDGRITARPPMLRHRKILSRRERRPEFAYDEKTRGAPVCCI